MHIPWLTDFVIFAQENGAPAAGQGAEQAPQGGFGMFVPLIGIFLIFWFLIIRPQSKQQKERNIKIKAARKGDNVVTIGGVYGKIVKETELDVVLEVDKHSKTRIQFQRTAIQDVINSATASQEAVESREESGKAESGSEDGAPPMIEPE
ncbi:MAG: preprotein translocase subunit YajC [Planctomycetota bacterium]|nr:preprotein translocase subunit YajC [Planctomycetota bacterium]